MPTFRFFLFDVIVDGGGRGNVVVRAITPAATFMMSFRSVDKSEESTEEKG